MPSHVFINCLKAEKLPAILICIGSLFHIFDPRTLNMSPPDIKILGWCPVGSVLPNEKVPF